MLLWTSLLFFIGFLVTGAIDGMYFHIRRFRLWAHPASWVEHVLHTLRAVLIPVMLWLFYLTGGARLGVAAALVAVDLVATVLDVAYEPKARKQFGGLPRAELVIHVVATLLHVTAVVLFFASHVLEGSGPPSALLQSIALPLTGASALAAAHHLVLVALGVPTWTRRAA